MSDNPFHEGEREAQRLADVRPSGAAIRDYMPDQHRAFFAQLPLLPVSTVDNTGMPVATILVGPPGFVVSPDPRHLLIAAHPAPDDPAAAHLVVGAPVGILGIDLSTRRRNRANGQLVAADETGLAVAITQSFGNCPQYIQARDLTSVPAVARPAEHLASIDAGARNLIRGADTFFVASSAGSSGSVSARVDISHRGGRPGFVRVDHETLTIPDFRGNRYFNTLGNFALDPRAALLFVDFMHGDLLHLAGRVEVVWGGDEVRRFKGAERLWRLHVSHGWRRRDALPLRWSFLNYAPTTEGTGTWLENQVVATHHHDVGHDPSSPISVDSVAA